MTRVGNDRGTAGATPDEDEPGTPTPARGLTAPAAREPRPTARGTVRVLHRAAIAYERGDRYLHVQQPLSVSAGAGADVCSPGGQIERDHDLLGALWDVGWELVHVSYVPVSSDAVARTGSATRGSTVVGIYLFQADHRPRPYPRDAPA